MASLTEAQLKKIHGHSFRNEASVMASHLCGCFHCLRIFATVDIKPDDIYPENDGVGTVWCPHCGIDSVLGDSIGIPITPDLLTVLKDEFF